MDRGAWQATVHGVTRVGHDLATKPPPYSPMHDQSCQTLFHPHGMQPARLLCPQNFPGKNTRVGCHFLLQGCSQPRDQTYVSWIGRQVLYHQHHQGSPGHMPLLPFEVYHKALVQHDIFRKIDSHINGREQKAQMGFPRIALAIRGPLCFHIKFRIFCSIYVGEKNPWDCFESVDCFTKHGHFNNGNSSNHEHMIYFHFCMTSCFLTMPYPFQYTGLSHSRLNLFLSTLFFFNS